MNNSMKRSRQLRRWLVAGAIVPLLVVAAGCGQGGDSSASSKDGVTTLKVALIPVLDFAPLQLGIEKGYFEDEGLKLDIQSGVSGASIFPSLLAGQADIGSVSYGSLILAATQDVPIVSIATAAENGAKGSSNDLLALMAPDSSDVKSAEDLKGATVALNSLGGVNALFSSAVAKLAGVDPSTLKFLAIPFPDQAAALRDGRVDAALMTEPFITQASSTQKLERLGGSNDLISDLGVTNWNMSREYATKNPDVVAKFRRAIAKSNEYANAHADEVRELLPDFAGLEESVAQDVALPVYATEEDPAEVQKIADLMTEYKVIDEKVDMADYFAPRDE